MLYSLAADFLVILHLAFICFVIFGGLFLLKWRKLIYLHLPAVIWGTLIELQGWFCPLTPLEQHFRTLAGETGYRVGFIQHYLLPLIYPADLTPELQTLFALCVITVNVVIYTVIYRRYRQDKQA